MKIYKEDEETKKSWALKLEDDDINGGVDLNAVDSITGVFITHLIYFRDGVGIRLALNSKEALENNGYDPNEHGNNFDDIGRLIIVGFNEKV